MVPIVGFLHQFYWLPRYSWNIVESGVKHHNTPKNIDDLLIELVGPTTDQYIYISFHIIFYFMDMIVC
jgi:hypothetical protein